MRVEKFRSIDEMNAAPDTRSLPADVERFFRHCARYRLMARKVYPRGVFKFHSIEEAQAARLKY
jgi:hypothetical protein